MVNSKTRGSSKLLAFIMALLMMMCGMFQTMPAFADEGGDAKQVQVASNRPSDAPRSEAKEDERQDAQSIKQDEESKKPVKEDEQEDSLDGDKENANAPPAGEGNSLFDAIIGFFKGMLQAEASGRISIPVTVTWDDDNNSAGNRPTDGLTYTLYALENGSIVKKTDIFGATTGHTFTAQYERGDDGKLIVYYVVVSPVPHYYAPVATNAQDAVPVAEGMGYSFCPALGDTVLNFELTAEPTVTFTLIKEWQDEGYEDKRPDSIEIAAYNYGTEVERFTLSAADSHTTEYSSGADTTDVWVKEVTLPQYQNNNGNLSTQYYFSEIETDDDYVLDYEHCKSFNTGTGRAWGYQYDVFIWHNTYKDLQYPHVQFPVTVVWEDDNNSAGIRPDSVRIGCYRNGWNVEDYPPYDIVPMLTADGNWTTTFEINPYFNNGIEIVDAVITVDEPIVPDGYRCTVSGNTTDGFVITNTLIKQYGDINVPVQVVWEDQGNLSNRRPSSVQINVSANGSASSVANAFVGAEDETPWSHTFTLPEGTDEGGVITYTVDGTDNLYYDKAITGSATAGFTITYTLKAKYESTHVPVSVVWVDDNDAAGKRPAEVHIGINHGSETFQGNGGYSADLSEENSWAHTFLVPKNDMDGNPLTYTLDTSWTSASPSGYTRSITGNQTEGFVITYTIEEDEPEVESVSITVKKTWNDNDNELGNRPEDVTFLVFDGNVSMYASNGVFTEASLALSGVQGKLAGRHKFVVSEESEQDCVINGLPKYDGEGNEIQYYVFELASHYRVTRMANNEWDGVNPVEFENSPINLNVVIEKIWDDDNDAAGERPDSITISAYSGTGEAATVTLNKEDATIDQDGNRWIWSNVFAENNLPRFDKDGGEIEYNVLEEGLPQHYICAEATRTIKPVTYHFTNRYFEGDKRVINVHKEWKDEGYENERPASVTVRLLSDGDEVDSAVLSEENQWQHTFLADLYTEEEGLTYYATYDVVEDAVEGYESAINLRALDEYSSASRYLFTITNTRIADEKLKDIVVNKVWEDDNNAAGERPKSITVHLNANGKVVETVELSEATEWSYKFASLPAYNEEGNEITYGIVEDEVSGYSAGFKSEESEDGSQQTITLINSYIRVQTPSKEVPPTKETPQIKNIPQLGAEGIAALMVAVALIVVALVGATIVWRRRN